MNNPTPSSDQATSDGEAARIEKLEAFAKVLAEKRKEAVNFKQQSGIERDMIEDEEAYEGIDDANREDMATLKGATKDSPLTTRTPAKTATKSNIFVNITQTYVDMAAASVADMLLPTDDMPFAVKPDPQPDIDDAVDDQTVLTGPNGQQTTIGQAAQMMLKEAEDSAKKAETQIWDWLTDAKWHAEVRKLICEAAKTGTAILKGPFPIKQKKKRIDRATDGAIAITMVEKTIPSSKEISAKNFFPDPACGENIHNGSYTWERDTITARGLRDLKGMQYQDGTPMYLDSQIDKVLEEGPAKKYETGGKPEAGKAEKEEFEIWYFHGTASDEAMQAAGCTCKPGAAIPCIVTMVNERVIKATLSTMDSGAFPYDVLRWQRIAGTWVGKSEGRKIRAPQRMLNGAVRNMMDNGGLSSGPQIVIDTEVIVPADGKWEITPRKVWKKIAGVIAQKVEDAITSIEIKSMQQELEAIVRLAIEFADKCATMPLQQQGQQGVTQETAEGRRLLQNNASVQKRALAKIFDDDITEPHIDRYYEWLLLYGTDPSMKREFVIDARGSTALFERDAENMAVAQLAPIVKDPAFGLDPKRWIKEFLKSNKLSPDRFEYTPAELKQIQAATAKQPQDKSIEVAQIKEEGETKRLQTELAAEAAEKEKDRQLELIVQQIAEHIVAMKLNGEKELSFEDLKAELMETAMKARTQSKLSVAGMQVDLHKHHNPPPVLTPPVEPAGRAPDGQAFAR